MGFSIMPPFMHQHRCIRIGFGRCGEYGICPRIADIFSCVRKYLAFLDGVSHRIRDMLRRFKSHRTVRRHGAYSPLKKLTT